MSDQATGKLKVIERRNMTITEIVLISAITAAVVSVVICNISARITLEIIDRYVQDVVDNAKKAMKSIRDTYVNESDSKQR